MTTRRRETFERTDGRGSMGFDPDTDDAYDAWKDGEIVDHHGRTYEEHRRRSRR